MKARTDVRVNTEAYRAARRAYVCRRARRRYKLRAAGRLPALQPRAPQPPAKPRRRLIQHLTITGETKIQRLLREARLAVRRRFPATPPVSWYGGPHHSARRRYDLAVHEEFHQRLREAGVEVVQ